MSKPSPLHRIGWVDLPVVEASGLTTRMVNGQLEVIVVGDRTWHIGRSTFVPSDGFSEWKTIDLSSTADRPTSRGDSQLEAIAVDGGSLVAIMREDPPVVLIADTEERRLRSRITLTAPVGSPLHGDWDDASSRGEGLALLRGGRLLVAKEKRPRALVEFCPAGSPAQGLSREDFLDDGEAWDAPEGDVEFIATAMWRLKGRAKKKLHDISDIAVGSDRTLWLLSDKSAAIAQLTLDTPLPPSGGEIRSVDHAWRLPARTTKPEGIAPLGNRRILIAMDTGSTHRNGMIIEYQPNDDPAE